MPYTKKLIKGRVRTPTKKQNRRIIGYNKGNPFVYDGLESYVKQKQKISF